MGSGAVLAVGGEGGGVRPRRCGLRGQRKVVRAEGLAGSAAGPQQWPRPCARVCLRGWGGPRACRTAMVPSSWMVGRRAGWQASWGVAFVANRLRSLMGSPLRASPHCFQQAALLL